MRRRHTRVRRGVAVLVTAAGLAAVLGTAGGCAADPDPSPPAGVDQLTIPTPSPDPADYVVEVDNPWFPLDPGSEQVWSSHGGAGAVLRVTVLAQPHVVAGVSATAVRTAPAAGAGAGPGDGAGGRGARVGTDYYAQDADGNVWWLGREGVWEAGVDGARAGLLMAATPRSGDGYRTAYLRGVVEPRAEVVAVEEDTVQVRHLDALRPGSTRLTTYRRGVGPVRVETAEGVLERVSDPA